MSKILVFISLLLMCNSIAAQKIKFGKVSKAEIEEKSHPLEPSSNAAILYREYKTHFNQSEQDGFYLVTEVFERIKIYKKEGFDYATQKIRLADRNNKSKEEIQNFKAYTYNIENGKIVEVKLKKDGIFEEKLNDFWKLFKFTMPDIKEGSVIEFKYKIKSPFIDDIDAFQIQENIPVNKYNLKFASPEYFNYKTHQKGWYPFKLDKSSKSRSMRYNYIPDRTGAVGIEAVSQKTETIEIEFVEKIITVNKSNIPSIKQEPLSGNIDNYKASLKMELSFTKFPNSTIDYYTTNWEDVSKTIYNSSSFGGELQKASSLKKEMDAIIAKASGENEKILAIYEYVKRNIKWNKFTGIYTQNGIKKTFKNKEGNIADINLLLIGLLREAGVKANPILISTLDHGIPTFPTRNGFNYVIAGVEVKDNVILLDAINKHAAPSVLSDYVMNWKGRLIRKEGSSTWVSLIPKKHSVNNVMVNATIDNDLNANGNLKEQITGNYALKFREKFSGLSEIDTRKKLEELADQSELSAIKTKNLNNPYESVQLGYDFETDTAVEKIGNKILISPMIFLGTDVNPFISDERKLPIYYGYPQKDRYLITFNLPDGYEVESIPEATSFSLENSAGNYKYITSNDNGKVMISVELKINKTVFSAEQHEGLKRFYQMIVDKENEKIVLRKI